MEKETLITTSKKWALDVIDWVKSTVTAVGLAVFSVIAQMLEAWVKTPGTDLFSFSKVDLVLVLKVAVGAFLVRLVERWQKGPQTVIVTKPPLTDSQAGKVVKALDDDGGSGGTGNPGGDTPSDPDKPRDKP